MRQPEPVCLAGKIQASVGSSQVRLALWGVEGEKTWVCPQPPCPEGGPLSPRAGSWGVAKGRGRGLPGRC